MDKTSGDVRAIQSKLHTSRKNLHEHDQLNEKVFKSKDVRVRASSFIGQLENIEGASTTVNVQPQMSWAFDEFGAIDRDLISAYQHADSAVTFSDNQTYKLMDIKEEVEMESNNLKEHNATVERLLATAKKQISENTKRIEDANTSISSNEADIREHEKSIEEKEQKISQLEKDVSTKESQKHKANENRKDARNAAIASGVVTGISVALIPFTFGLSGFVAGASGVGMGVAIDKAIDYKKEVKRLQGFLWELNKERSTLATAVSSLKLRNIALKKDVEQYRQEIKEKEVEVPGLEKQIRDGDKTRKEITSVESHATSTLSTVKDVLPELRNIRNNLEKFSDLVKERSIEVEASADLTFRVMKHVPVLGTKMKRRRNFEAQVSVLKQVVETLDQLHRDIPSLLPANVTKVLDIKPWNLAKVSVFEVTKDIPSITLF